MLVEGKRIVNICCISVSLRTDAIHYLLTDHELRLYYTTILYDGISDIQIFGTRTCVQDIEQLFSNAVAHALKIVYTINQRKERCIKQGGEETCVIKTSNSPIEKRITKPYNFGDKKAEKQNTAPNKVAPDRSCKEK